jgi:hypothetical protein
MPPTINSSRAQAGPRTLGSSLFLCAILKLPELRIRICSVVANINYFYGLTSRISLSVLSEKYMSMCACIM